MAIAKRYNENPVLLPQARTYWEAQAVFNGCPIKEKQKIHLFYRAMSASKHHAGFQMNLSTIGYAASRHLDDFQGRRQLIAPSEDWDKYGCEDPRVTKMNGKYYIFYTALSKYPFEASGIRVGLAVTKDLEKIDKHQITTFNSKAMALFPEKIKGKYTVILTADTDNPPAKIAIASFSKESDMWSKRYWNRFYEKINDHKVGLRHGEKDHLEIGAPPIKTKYGWLLVYSHIKRYFTPNDRTFEIRAALLDLKDPTKVIGQSREALLVPEDSYEIYGEINNIVFPSGAFISGNELHIYYGAADTVCAAAKFRLQDVINEILEEGKDRSVVKRYKGNPIISPRPENKWEDLGTYNPGALYLNGKFHIIYRAQAKNGRSVLGYASSKNGFTIDERLDEPIYVPRENFEIKESDGFSGCEDPRLVAIGDNIHMFYTAYDGINPPSVAFTSIKKKDFLAKKWKWTLPRLISPLRQFNKNACVFPEKIKGKYAVLHRINKSIDFHYTPDLSFKNCSLCEENNWLIPRRGSWDDAKVGIAGPPVKTEYGW
ncbi:hypothetical protein GF382_03325, partial [Candidatus Falkowbacteria bacterium]|nr:hypothetical protein [Candidatus Falkowbacteria bacterium]